MYSTADSSMVWLKSDDQKRNHFPVNYETQFME